MSKGEIRKLTCPPDYAYGDLAVPPSIPAKATLIFEIELLDFK
jgi:FKBP-type peptidyl-prolyl cis-trans isomerase